ncbi:hypothetical protein KKB18_12625 [bacterium]|nr:hypothetical protein [bacterium]
MSSKRIKKYNQINQYSKGFLSLVIKKVGLSARAYDRMLNVRRRIAYLAGEEHIK